MFSFAFFTLLRTSALTAALAWAPIGRPAPDGAAPSGSASETPKAAPSEAGTPPVPETAPTSETDTRVAVSAALGDRLFKLGRYDEAVGEYRRAYELRADPRFLYHIAECYRELGVTAQALFYYERYLAGAPDAPDRDEVRDKIAELEAARAKPSRTRPRMVLVPEPAPPPAYAVPWRRWWFWTAVGGVVAAGTAAVILARRPDTNLPATDLGDQRFY